MQIQKTRYSNPALEAYLTQKLEEYKRHIVISAQRFAEKNQPPLANRKIHSYFQEDHHRYQHLLDKVNTDLQFKASVNEVIEHNKLTDTRVRIMQNNLAEAKEQQIGIDVALQSKHRPFNGLKVLLVWLAIITLGLFEGALSFGVFQIYGFSQVESIGLSVLFAGLVTLYAATFERIVQLGKKLWQRRAIAASLLLLVILLSTFMSIERAKVLSIQATAYSSLAMHFSAIPFVCLSVLLYVVAVAVHYFFMPTKEERKAKREHAALHRQKSDNEKLQQRLLQEKDACLSENSELKKANASILEYGYMLESLIRSHAEGGLALWKKHNIMHRPDNGRPVSFDDETYPFAFQSNFHTINNTQS